MKERNFSDYGGRDKKRYGTARGAGQGQRRSHKQWQPQEDRRDGEQRREFGRTRRDGFRDARGGGCDGGAERYVKRDRGAGAPRRGEDFKRDAKPRQERDSRRREGRDGGQRHENWREGRRDYRSDDNQRPRRELSRDDKDFRRDRRDGRDFQRDHRDFRRDRKEHGSSANTTRQPQRGDREAQARHRGERFERRGGRSQERDFGRGGTRGAGRSDRGGRERTFTEAERIAHELRPVRAAHTDPEIPDEVLANQLQPSARNELKTLEKDNADRVARHLVMVRELIHFDPELAQQHAISAARRAGRIPVARETLAITAYALGDFAMALREYRTWRRLTGRNDHIAFMVDCERGLGRPEKGLELAAQVDQADIPQESRVHLAIAVSGARLDLGQLEQARAELEIPQLDARKAYQFSPELFRAYAAVLEELGDAAAAEWERLAERAEAALLDTVGDDELLVTDAMASAAELAERGIDLGEGDLPADKEEA